MERINNVSLSLEIDGLRALFNIYTADARFPWLENIQIGCEFSLDGKKHHHLRNGWRGELIRREVVYTLEHGEMELLAYSLRGEPGDLSYALTFAIPHEHPLAIWKIEVGNHGKQPVRIDRITLLAAEFSSAKPPRGVRIGNPSDLGFFSNGWQSWSPSRWYNSAEKMNLSRLGLLQHPMIYNPGTPLPRKRGLFSSDMFAVIGEKKAGVGFLVGFLSQKNHFGSIYADFNKGSLSMWANGDNALLEPGARMETDWAVFTPVLLGHRAPMEDYFEAVARENHALIPAGAPVGWCSWYHFYTGVTADNIEDNLNAVIEQQESLPVELVQIDDGYQTQAGDWLTFRSTFPRGVKPLAEEISDAGLIPGLWQAPFIVHPRSTLAREHPEWLLRKADGKPVNTGFVWNTLNKALDLTVPGALEYAKIVVSTAAQEWGFPYLKLDFLYAAALKGEYHDRSKTRAQVMRMGMEALRAAVGPRVTLLGCGAPLGSVVGIVDAMRIGPDVSGDWLPRFGGISSPLRHEPSMPSARNSIHNILTRANLNRYWWMNDPDCLLIRPDTNLSLDEVRSLATVIALSGGSLLLSDDLTALPVERLRIAEVLLPVIEEDVRVLDLFEDGMPEKLRVDITNEIDTWHVLGRFNWSDSAADFRVDPASFQLDDDVYLFREFWSGWIGRFDANTPAVFNQVAPHGCVLVAARKLQENQAQYIGSDLHFTQGSEVVAWHEEDQALEMTLRLPRTTEGEIFLRLPFKPGLISVNGTAVALSEELAQVYRVPLKMAGFCMVRIIKE